MRVSAGRIFCWSRGAEADRKGLEDSRDDAILHVEEVVPPAVDFLGCEGVAGSGVDERRGDADSLADPLVAAADNPPRVEVAANLDGDAGIVLGTAQPAQALDDADAAGDADGFEFREIGGEAFGDAGAEPVEIGGAADVPEVDDRESGRCGVRRLGALCTVQLLEGCGEIACVPVASRGLARHAAVDEGRDTRQDAGVARFAFRIAAGEDRGYRGRGR